MLDWNPPPKNAYCDTLPFPVIKLPSPPTIDANLLPPDPPLVPPVPVEVILLPFPPRIEAPCEPDVISLPLPPPIVAETAFWI